MTTDPAIVLPPIVRRVHPRAKRLKLRIVQGQIFLTIPPHAKTHEIEQFIQQSQPWLQQHFIAAPEQPNKLSTADDFLNQSNSLSIKILEHKKSVVINRKKNSKLFDKANVIYLPEHAPAKQLTAWILIESKRELPKRLAELAARYQFSYQKCSVRHAKTRWGSCNQQGSISLNAGLALLDQVTMDYVLLHELCHTRQMNHSAQFWAEVAKVCPDYQTQRKLLRQFRWPVWWDY